MEAAIFEVLKMVASGVVSGAATKIGEPLGEGVIVAARRVVERLQLEHPETANLLAAAESSEVIEAKIIEEVKRAAAADPVVQAALDETAAAIAADQTAYPHLTKVADKAGNVFMGPVSGLKIEQSFS